jgi:hypothetical protein
MVGAPSVVTSARGTVGNRHGTPRRSGSSRNPGYPEPVGGQDSSDGFRSSLVSGMSLTAKNVPNRPTPPRVCPESPPTAIPVPTLQS